MAGELLLLLLNKERFESLPAASSRTDLSAPEPADAGELPKEPIRGMPLADPVRETLLGEELARTPESEGRAVSFLLSRLLKMPVLGGSLPPSVESDRKLRLLILETSE